MSSFAASLMFISPTFSLHCSRYFFSVCFVGSLYSVCLLNIEHRDTGSNLLKDEGNSLIGWAVSLQEWFKGNQPTLRSIPECFAWWSFLYMSPLQKAPVKLPFCSLKGVNLASITMSAQTEFQSSSLSQWREKEIPEISEEGEENIWNMGCCLASRHGKEA